MALSRESEFPPTEELNGAESGIGIPPTEELNGTESGIGIPSYRRTEWC